MFGKSVEAEREIVALAAGGDFKGQAVGGDEFEFDQDQCKTLLLIVLMK